MNENLLPLTSTTTEESGGGCGCGCGTDSAGDRERAAVTPGAAAVSSAFEVSGMTCGHCVAAVTKEVSLGVPGVSDVQVDLASGRVTVLSDRPLEEDAVRNAVEEAGYQLVPGSVR